MNSMMQIGIALVAFDRMSRVVGDAVGKSGQHLSAFQKRVKETSEKLATMGAASMFGGSQVLNQIQKPIDAFMELEDASTQLESTMMEAGGTVPKTLAAINREAKYLGDRLPGTTADFARMASSLKSLGVTDQAISGGVLRSAAFLGVVLKPMKVTYEEAAESAAKFKMAMGIDEKDMVPFMDVIQRVAHLGVKLEEQKYAFSRVSGVLKPLGIQGLQASKELAPLIGTMIQMGYEGERTGTGLGNMILQMTDTAKVKDTNEALAKYGISLQFMDEATGKFKGIPNLVAQLDKLKVLKDTDKIEVAKKLFGTGGDEKIALTLMTEGVAGYNRMVAAMSKQADLNRRVERSLTTLGNVWEAFTGTAQNALAMFGGSMAPVLKSITTILNTTAAAVGGFSERHQTLSKILGLGIGTLGLALVSFGALGIAVSVLFRVTGTSIAGLGKLFFLLRNGIIWVQLYTERLLLSSIGMKAWAAASWVGTAATKAWTLAVRLFNITLLGCPLGWIAVGIAALAVGAYFLWKNWDKVSKALSTAWAWMKSNWEKALKVFLWVNPITVPIMAMQKLVKYLFGIDLLSAGKNIIMSLWRGMTSVIGRPLEAMKGLVGRMRNLLPFSPAKDGPFRDLHKLKIMQTIASTITPVPLVTALGKALHAGRSVLNQTGEGRLQPPNQLNRAGSPGRSGGTGAITLNYNPTITFPGSTSPADKDSFAAMLRQHKDELKQMLQSIAHGNARTAY